LFSELRDDGLVALLKPSTPEQRCHFIVIHLLRRVVKTTPRLLVVELRMTGNTLSSEPTIDLS
jgi:hypothetical protein